MQCTISLNCELHTVFVRKRFERMSNLGMIRLLKTVSELIFGFLHTFILWLSCVCYDVCDCTGCFKRSSPPRKLFGIFSLWL